VSACATHPRIQQLIEARVAQLNTQLASYETIKKFIIAPTDFTPESGELTPTLKIKRKVVTQQYQAQLDQLYEAG
jgi:long-chain acyl-CoA synthetase